MRNADSGLDLDDSGSGNDSYFHQSESDRRGGTGTTTQSGEYENCENKSNSYERKTPSMGTTLF